MVRQRIAEGLASAVDLGAVKELLRPDHMGSRHFSGALGHQSLSEIKRGIDSIPEERWRWNDTDISYARVEFNKIPELHALVSGYFESIYQPTFGADRPFVVQVNRYPSASKGQNFHRDLQVNNIIAAFTIEGNAKFMAEDKEEKTISYSVSPGSLVLMRATATGEPTLFQGVNQSPLHAVKGLGEERLSIIIRD